VRLKDKIAIVTGGASGLGKAMVDRFAREGAIIVVADIDDAAAEATVAQLNAAGARASALHVDVSSQEAAADAMAEVVARQGRIDILVNNAGVSRYRPFATMTAQDWDTVLGVDLKGVFFCAQAVAPIMIAQGAGKIVNISSTLGTGTTPHTTTGSPGGTAAYAAAKAGVIMLTKTLARELGPHGINVNCVAPGTFQTPMTLSTRTPEEAAEHIAHRIKTVVLGRPGQPEELAAAVAFLASEDAAFIAGHTLFVDGGRIDRM
jgi:NAD(P)-dependent dehydrogenase (short-subunit alcohol dehydrogenase family)